MSNSWPLDTFPVSYGLGMQLGGFGARVQTNMDSGHIRRRQRFTNVPVKETITLGSLSDTEVEKLKTFYAITTNMGTKGWYARVPVGDSLLLCKCYFLSEALDFSNVTYNQWSCSFDIEIRTGIVFSVSASYLIGLYGGTFLEDTFIDPLDTAINVTIPEMHGLI